MSLVRWNAARDLPAFPSDLLTMQREINRVFSNFFREGTRGDEAIMPSAWMPVADLVEEDDAYVVRMEIPGVAKEDVQITIQGGVLAVRGEKKKEKEICGSQYHRMERSYGSFTRSFAFPSAVKTDAIDAAYKDGILQVTLPRADDAPRKQIEVKVR
jgi:HSP20 family protein